MILNTLSFKSTLGYLHVLTFTIELFEGCQVNLIKLTCISIITALLTTLLIFIRKRRKKKNTEAVWSYLHAAMSLGKRQHEIWTEGGSGRVNIKDTIKENHLNKKIHFTHQKLLITTQSLKNEANLRH